MIASLFFNIMFFLIMIIFKTIIKFRVNYTYLSMFFFQLHSTLLLSSYNNPLNHLAHITSTLFPS